ncbi:MAG: class I SAM-dependent methyltransferase [Pseudomonadota bacterium]
MFERQVNAVRKRWHWVKYRDRLESVATMDDFKVLLDETDNSIFAAYKAWDPISRKDVSAVLDALSIDINGKRFLDVGPGYGSALDIARERGASAVEFVDYDPFVCAFNRIKGHTGWCTDVRTKLSSIAPRQYDFIWLKATFSANRFIDRERGLGMLGFYLYPKLESILTDVDRLLAPGGIAVFCPHWDFSGTQRRTPDVQNTPVTTALKQQGYLALPWIPDHHMEPIYPISFIKTTPGAN